MLVSGGGMLVSGRVVGAHFLYLKLPQHGIRPKHQGSICPWSVGTWRHTLGELFAGLKMGSTWISKIRCVENIMKYCWWLKSGVDQLRLVVYPIYLQGFIHPDFSHQQYVWHQSKESMFQPFSYGQISKLPQKFHTFASSFILPIWLASSESRLCSYETKRHNSIWIYQPTI